MLYYIILYFYKFLYLCLFRDYTFYTILHCFIPLHTQYLITLCESAYYCSTSLPYNIYTSALPESVTEARFTVTPPQYIWYDKTDGTKSSSNTVPCDGGVPRGTVAFTKYIYKSGDRLLIPPLTIDASTTSGVYQCAIYEGGDKFIWLQQTTEVVVAGNL